VASLDEFAREQAIMTLLKSSGHAVVSDLVDTFGVSAVTIRKDLDALEKRHLLRRVRGGAVSVDGGDEGSFEMRMRQSSVAKRAIARAAAAIPVAITGRTNVGRKPAHGPRDLPTGPRPRALDRSPAAF